MGRFDTLLGWLKLIELLVKESWNFALGQEVIKLFAGVHGVSHKDRCRQISDREILACLEFDVPWHQRIDHGRLWLHDFVDRPEVPP